MGPLRRFFRFAAPAPSNARRGALLLLAGAASPLLFASTPARAEEPSDSARYRLPPVVVTAERAPVPLDRVPSDLTLIGRERFERDQAPFVSDELRLVPALDIRRSGTPGKLTDVRLRGADPRHTLVLFDGIPLNGPWAGTFDFADLPGAALGQVEVMGGPASSLYGSGAVGGVIQFLSPGGPLEGLTPESRLRAGAEYGERATLRQSLEWSGADAVRQGGFYASRFASDGEGPRDEYEGFAGRASGAMALGGGQVRVSGIGTRATKQIPDDYRFDTSDFLTHQVLDPNTEETDRVLAGRLSYSRELIRLVSVEAEASAFSGRIDYENRADSTGGDFVDTRLDNSRGIASLRARLGERRTELLLGAEYRGESVNRDDDSQYGGFASASLVDRSLHVRSLYAQTHAERRRLLLDAGIRLEDHSRYGAIGVPRVALGVPVPEAGLKLRAGYGRAFTAPTLSDLYYPFYGSETLRPERSRTWEAGVDGAWLHGVLEARATWHRTRFRDLIQSNSFFVADNIGRARIEGGEASVRIAPTRRAAVGAWAARLIGKNLEGGARLAKRPRWRGGASVDLAPVPWGSAYAALEWSESMTDPFNFVDPSGRYLGGDTPAFATLDVGAVASLARWLPAEARIRVSNALDRSYEEVKGYPAPGRRVTVGLAYRR